MLYLADIAKIYSDGVPKSGIKDHYAGRITRLHKRNVARYALKHTINLASIKYGVNKNTIATYVTEHKKGVY